MRGPDARPVLCDCGAEMTDAERATSLVCDACLAAGDAPPLPWSRAWVPELALVPALPAPPRVPAEWQAYAVATVRPGRAS